MIKQTNTPSGLNVKFFPLDHKYQIYDSTGNVHISTAISVTTLISKYAPQFDKEKIADLCSVKRKIPKEELIKEWDIIAKEASNFGTKMHQYAEELMLGKSISVKLETEKEIQTSLLINKVITTLKRKLYNIECEKIIYNDKLNIAGTIDLLARSKKDNNWIVIDWKTNKQIRKNNPYKEFFKSPISYLSHCEYNEYGLQLSMYEKLLKDSLYIDPNSIVKKYIIHYNHINNKIDTYNMPTFEKEISSILHDWCKF